MLSAYGLIPNRVSDCCQHLQCRARKGSGISAHPPQHQPHPGDWQALHAFSTAPCLTVHVLELVASHCLLAAGWPTLQLRLRLLLTGDGRHCCCCRSRAVASMCLQGCSRLRKGEVQGAGLRDCSGEVSAGAANSCSLCWVGCGGGLTACAAAEQHALGLPSVAGALVGCHCWQQGSQ